MLTILAFRNNWHQLDLYENEPVNLTYSFQDVQKVNNPSGDYSQTFRVPLTERNQRVFGAYDLSQVMPFDIKRKVDAALLIGGVEIMRGFLQVKNWYVQKGQFVDLELTFFGGAKSLAAAVGESKLSDLNWTSFNHDLTYNNVTDSWDGNLYSGQIRYGIVDRGANWRGSGDNPGNTPLLPRDLTPFIRIKTIVEKIFTTYGFTLQSSFLNSAAAMYMMLHNGKRELKITSGGGQAIAFYAGFTTNTTFTAPSGWTTLQLSDGGNFYDLGADFAAGQWQVPATGTYYMRGFYSFDLSNPAATLSLRLYNTTTSTAYPLVTDEFDYNTSYQWGMSTINTPFGYALDATNGHIYVLQFQISSGGGNVTFYAGATNGLLGIGGTSWNVHGYVPTTSQLDVARNMPDIRCIDFLLGLQRCFNLVFIPDKHDKTKISVEPISTYLSSGTAKDWTNQIDLTQDIVISPTSDLQKRKYVWTHSEGGDIVNQAFKESTGYVYGRHEILDPENDFAQGEELITSGFSPFVTSYIPGTSYNILRLLKSEGEDLSIDEVKPHLAFWNGKQSLGFEMKNGNTTILETFPLFTAYNDANPDCKDYSLMFGISLPFFPIIANPINTLYYAFYSQYVIDLYSSDARILTAKFRLTTLDISNFNWNDVIRLFGNDWRVLEISGFDATQEGCVTIKLLKRLNAGRDCEYLPTTGRTGRIEFEDADGDNWFQTPRKCCERYGFFYDASTAYCYQPE